MKSKATKDIKSVEEVIKAHKERDSLRDPEIVRIENEVFTKYDKAFRMLAKL